VDIIPAIDIRGGRCVRLEQGDYDRETVFGVDPVAMAVHWASQGAARLHVVDLDAAKEGRPVNDAIIKRIVTEAGVPVQVAGGVRDHAAIHRWADCGADRIVIGTLAAQEPAEIDRAMVRHRDKIAVSVDARGGKVAVKGWLETTELSVPEFIRDMAARGVRHFIYTDIDRDGLMAHPDFDELGAVARVVAEATEQAEQRSGSDDEPSPIILGGGITSVDDIVALSQFDIEGVITGRALYDGRIDLRAAQRALAVGDDW
jgi:phosphoribosylformimino-5-aminoimidazole carboxamide ribotide isomerase